MDNFIVFVVITLILGVAIASTINRKKKGACCSGGGGTIREKKELDAPKIGEMEVKILQNRINCLPKLSCNINYKK